MALISFAVTAKLICVFVFAYAKSRFSHDAAHTRTQQTTKALISDCVDVQSVHLLFIHAKPVSHNEVLTFELCVKFCYMYDSAT